MHALLEIYRRYFKYHTIGLLLTAICFIGFAAEGSIMAAMSRYLVDEVLQVDRTARLMLNGSPDRFVDDDAVLPGDARHAPQIEALTDGHLPGEEDFTPVTFDPVSTQGGLENQFDAKSGLSNARKLKMLAVIAFFLIVIHLTAVALQAWSDVKLGRITEQVVFTMRRHIHDKLLRLQMSFHDQHQTGRLLSRAIDDVQVIEGHFANVLAQFARFGGLIVINVSLMFYISPKLALMALIAMPFYFIAYHKFRYHIRELHRTQRRKNAALYGVVRDRLANPRVVKGFGQEKREIREFFGRAKDLFRRNRRIVLYSNLLAMICTIISVSVTAGTLAYGVVMVQRGELSLGYLLFFYAVCHALFWPIAALSQLTSIVQWLEVACGRVLEVLNEPMTIVEHPRAARLATFSNEIKLDKVSFTFDGADAPAVSDIDLTIPKGSQVCLMGKSGAGKSTIGMLLLRLYDPTEGKITIDGSDLQRIKTSSLRKRISYVPQEPILFSGTLAGNILYGNVKANAEMMVNAAKAAEIDDFIAELPEGYQTMIGENGLRSKRRPETAHQPRSCIADRSGHSHP